MTRCVYCSAIITRPLPAGHEDGDEYLCDRCAETSNAMNVFDAEAPASESKEAGRIAELAAAGVTLEECRAYGRYLMQEAGRVQ